MGEFDKKQKKEIVSIIDEYIKEHLNDLISKILNKYSYEDVLKILMSSTDDKKYCYLKGYYKIIFKNSDSAIYKVG